MAVTRYQPGSRSDPLSPPSASSPIRLDRIFRFRGFCGLRPPREPESQPCMIRSTGRVPIATDGGNSTPQTNKDILLCQLRPRRPVCPREKPGKVFMTSVRLRSGNDWLSGTESVGLNLENQGLVFDRLLISLSRNTGLSPLTEIEPVARSKSHSSQNLRLEKAACPARSCYT